MSKLFERIEFLYKQAGIENDLDSDIKSGKVAKIDVTNDDFYYSEYARVSTSVSVENNREFQCFIFKPNYFYKNGKLVYAEENKRKKIIHTSIKDNQQQL